MIKLGVIGTNWITDSFVQAALGTKEWTLTAVYSRNINKSRIFGGKYDATIYVDSLQELAESPAVEVVYIASPNSLHYSQAVQMMKSGKHVIVEKPMFSNPEEWQAAAKIAKENHVLMLEAARHIHEPNFQVVKEQVRMMKPIKGATLSYMKYSNRYDNVLSGEEPNIFSLHFSGGALADLGVYPIYAAVSWFGLPQKSYYFSQSIQTGVDGMGTIILRYVTFDVTILVGKVIESYLPSEIYGHKQTIVLNATNGITDITTIDLISGEKLNHEQPQNNHPMYDEALEFATVIKHLEVPENQQKYQTWLKLSQEVNALLKQLRDDAGIVFDADKK